MAGMLAADRMVGFEFFEQHHQKKSPPGRRAKVQGKLEEPGISGGKPFRRVS